MTVEEINQEKERIILEMSTKNLNKRQEAEYNTLLNKLDRTKLDTNR